MTEKVVTTESSLRRPAAPAARPGTWLAALAVVVLASCTIFRGLGDEPHFADESAMIAQSYYYTLFKSGQWNHPDWFHYAAYDHPPLPKYLFGLSLNLAGLPTPTSIAAWENWANGDFSPPADPRVLYWARMPSAIFGVGGVLAAFLIGVQIRGRVFGMITAALVVLNPLYLTHARRAMSDSFTECLVLASVAAGLWGSRLVWSSEFRWRSWLAFVLATAVTCGLAALAKLNGGIAAVIVLTMLSGNWLLATWSRSRRATTGSPPGLLNLSLMPLAIVLVGLGSFAVFAGLNPYLTAQPPLGPRTEPKSRELATLGVVGRTKFLVEFRRQWTRDALANNFFRKDWLRTTPDRARMTVWEGFGRYSVLGPRNIRTIEPRPERERFSEYRRRASLVWFPLFVWGLMCVARDGWCKFRSGAASLVWALFLYAAAVLAIVILMIPLNWDRYFLPLQPCAALVVPYGLASTAGWIRSRLVLAPNTVPPAAG